jgi:hypothetical protein
VIERPLITEGSVTTLVLVWSLGSVPVPVLGSVWSLVLVPVPVLGSVWSLVSVLGMVRPECGRNLRRGTCCFGAWCLAVIDCIPNVVFVDAKFGIDFLVFNADHHVGRVAS